LQSNSNNNSKVFVVGAGLAGLSTAVNCIQNGHEVRVFEATNHAGGRCRSFKDTVLNRTINNGNHLILNGNIGVKKYLTDINALDNFTTSQVASFEFLDIKTNERWSLQPSSGAIPWWMIQPNKRIPNTRLRDYFSLLKLIFARHEALADLVDPSRPIFDRLWQPLSQAVLNTNAHEGSAALIWKMLSNTLLKGSNSSLPLLTKTHLSSALIEPAITYLKANGSIPEYGMRLRSLKINGSKISAIQFNNHNITLNNEDAIILALPPNEISALLPNITVPTKTNAILNVHYRLDDKPRLPNNAPFIGIVGGTAQWLFKQDDIYSVTISDAGILAKKSNQEIAGIVWQDISQILEVDKRNQPISRVIREMRATFAQTPEENKRRPDAHTVWKNLFLAGDWTNTGLPATIESAVISGQKAAKMLSK